MSGWEYKVVPAPAKGIKARGIKGPEGRFAHAIEMMMNEMAAEGWEYQRAETLPSVERSGLTGTITEWRNLLVFRRVASAPLDDFEPELLPAPADPDAPTGTMDGVATTSGARDDVQVQGNQTHSTRPPLETAQHTAGIADSSVPPARGDDAESDRS